MLEPKVHSSQLPIAIKNSKLDISSEETTKELAKQLSNYLKGGEIIFLYGEMGVGKTTFVKYLINSFQKKNKLEITEVTSPTFNLLNEYQINQIKIKHYDLFRLKSFEEIKNLDLFEDSVNSVTLIEWPQILEKKPKNLIELFFEYGKDHQKRFVQIKG